MVRSVLVLTALLSAPAWAVGERISLPKGPEFTEQLRETLCISMECGSGIDASITAKLVKGKAEIKVFSAAGELKGTITAPLNDDGHISSMDLVAATSGIISAIEASPASKTAKADAKAKKAVASKSKKKASLRLAAKARAGHTPG